MFVHEAQPEWINAETRLRAQKSSGAKLKIAVFEKTISSSKKSVVKTLQNIETRFGLFDIPRHVRKHVAK
jgi:hypothetical protein